MEETRHFRRVFVFEQRTPELRSRQSRGTNQHAGQRNVASSQADGSGGEGTSPLAFWSILDGAFQLSHETEDRLDDDQWITSPSVGDRVRLGGLTARAFYLRVRGS